MRPPYAVILGSSCLAALGAAGLHAQCPDGTPPPCEVRARQAVARRAPPPAPERGRSFLVLPFRNLTRSPDQQWMVEGSPTLLGDALSQWKEVSVVPSRRLFSALRRHDLTTGEVMDETRVRRVAEETGGWTVVEGDVLATGGKVRVRAQAYDAVTGTVLVAAAEEVPAGDVLAAYERLAGQLLKTAGLATPGSGGDLAAGTTRSLDAYKAYLRGIAQTNRSEFRRAGDSFLEAVRLDSSFALAWARAAEVPLMSFGVLTDTAYPGQRYAARAAALATRLPERDRQLVQVIDAFYAGQFGAARATLERLVAADSNDLDALRWLSHLEVWDLILDRDSRRPRGSLNRAARLAKRGLGLDPTQHRFYPALLLSYALASGIWGGMIPGYAQERSLRAMFTRFPDVAFVTLMRDTIELIPIGGLDELGEDSLQAARARAREVARAWVNRWLAAGPAEAEAHLWQSRLDELEGDFAAALAAVRRADSLGVESGWDDLIARRMVLLGKLGRYDQALGLADSLLDAGYFANAGPLVAVPGAFERAGWALMLFLRAGRMDRAERAIAPLFEGMRALGGPLADVMATSFLCGEGVALGVSPLDLPRQFRQEVAATALSYASRLPTAGFVPQCLIALVQSGAAGADPEARGEFLERARAAVAALADSGNLPLAVSIITGLVNTDTTVDGRVALVAVLRRVVAQQPDNLQAHYQIGKIGALTGRELDVAEASLQRYLAHPPAPGVPTHADAHWRLGMIHEHRGDLARARAAYGEALRLNPAHPQASQALQRLGAER